jgi:hypothetical protein
MSSECGEKLAYFYVEVQNGAPISFQCRATFIGPVIKVSHPIVDYGLVKVNTTQIIYLTIENTTPIGAELLIKS